jgi:uncharacterized protein (DUF427 family)
MPSRESLHHRHPEHRVELEAGAERVRVRLAGALLADSRHVLVVRETQHAPVFYFPRDDVRFDCLERTDHRTFCPFKGDASYWSARVGDRLEENVAWSYEDPFAEVAGLKDHVAFYAERVEWERGG